MAIVSHDLCYEITDSSIHWVVCAASARLLLSQPALLLQVEQNLNPSLKGRAFAIQQHQDIIAASSCAGVSLTCASTCIPLTDCSLLLPGQLCSSCSRGQEAYGNKRGKLKCTMHDLQCVCKSKLLLAALQLQRSVCT